MNKTDEWKKKLTEQENSGLTQAVWCKDKGISLSCFRYWKCKIDKNKIPEVKFLELQQENNTGFGLTPAISLEINDLKINVHRDANMQLLKTVIQAVKSC